MYSVIQVPNRPRFDNIRGPEQDEREHETRDGHRGYHKRDVHPGYLVPDDAAVIVHTDTPGARAANPDAGEDQYCGHSQLNIKSKIEGQPDEQYARQRTEGTGRDGRKPGAKTKGQEVDGIRQNRARGDSRVRLHTK